VPTPNAPPDALVARFSHDLTALTGPLPPTARIGIAVSGGPDSLALLLLAHAALPGQVVAATVDHQLRADAAEEAAMVGRICAAIGIPHSILRPTEPIDARSNVQEQARIARYLLLSEWGTQHSLIAVATAHHRDDVAESFLMRALRGSGISGLARMRAIGDIPYSGNAAAMLVRPLLEWDRAELADIVGQAGLTAIHDPSNHDPRYDRAHIRDLLQREKLLDAESLARSAANLADAETALSWMADLAWRSRVEFESTSELHFDPGDLPTEIRRRLAGRAIATLSPAWNGAGLDRLLANIVTGGIATLAGVKASGGAIWRFSLAPARRDHR
jgi:tRNA(Ile)-lysidine synthase